MTLIVFQVITQTISSTLHWFGLCFGIRTWAGPNPRQWPWLVGTTIVSAAWLVAIMLLAANNFFGNVVLPPRIPMAMGITLAFGYLLLLSTSFRGIIAAIPQHWLIGIQTFRVLGGVFIVRYLQGEMPGFFAIPAGVGDVLTGIFAPLVAYWLYSGKSYGRCRRHRRYSAGGVTSERLANRQCGLRRWIRCGGAAGGRGCRGDGAVHGASGAARRDVAGQG